MNGYKYRPLFEAYPKAKPLALLLLGAAAEQGAGAKELRIACEVAQEAYEKAQSLMESDVRYLSELYSKAITSINSIEKNL